MAFLCVCVWVWVQISDLKKEVHDKEVLLLERDKALAQAQEQLAALIYKVSQSHTDIIRQTNVHLHTDIISSPTC